MLIAVLEQHAGLRLADMRCLCQQRRRTAKSPSPPAIWPSSSRSPAPTAAKAIEPATAVIGEVGLGSEIRPVAHVEQRAREYVRLGYATLIMPPANARHAAIKGVRIVKAGTVSEAMDLLG
jgi:DNA repair protein RadA/Sms